MKIFKILKHLFSKIFTLSHKYRKTGNAPLLIIKKTLDNSFTKEYNSIDEVIEDLENDPNVSSEKIEKLKMSFKNLKNKSSIRIRNGEII